MLNQGNRLNAGLIIAAVLSFSMVLCNIVSFLSGGHGGMIYLILNMASSVFSITGFILFGVYILAGYTKNSNTLAVFSFIALML